MKPKFYLGLIPLLLYLVNGNANAQSTDTAVWAWVKSLSSTHSIYGNAIAIDPKGSGDIYIAGGFEGMADFDPGPGIFPLSTGGPIVGIFVSKFDGSGNFVWARALKGLGGGAAFAVSMAIDPVDGAIYTTGRIKGTIDFDPGPNTFNLTSYLTSCSAFPFCGDIFISKLDHEGNFVWAKVIGGSEDDFGASLAIDPGGSGDVYITGQFKDIVEFDPGDSTFNLASTGNYDIFICKLNSAGEFQWTKKLGGTGNDVGRAIAFDPEGMGNVYTTGQFFGTVDFDPGDSIVELTTTGNHENFISKLDKSGNFVWAKQMGKLNLGVLDNFGSIALDPEGSGEVYITGPFKGIGYFDPGDSTFTLTAKGNSDIFISKLSDAGEFKWAGAMGGTNQDYGTNIAIQPGGSGNVYIIGRFKGSADFDPGADSSKLTSIGAYDIFIISIDSAGNFNWVKAIKGTNEDYISAISIDKEFLYLTGFFNSPSVLFDSLTIPNDNTSGSGDDLFIAKLEILITSASFIDAKTQHIYLYPNPTTNELTIEFKGEEFFNVDISLFNVLGEVVYFIPNESIVQRKTIDISDLMPGIYFVELKRDGKSVVGKMVKQ